MTPTKDERGIALALALFALTVIAALVGSSFFAGRVEQQSGRNTVFAAQAREGAEAGLTEAMASVEAGTLAALAAGQVLGLETITLGNGVSVSRDVARLTSSLFLIRARGTRLSPAGMVLATRSLGAVVHLVPAPAAPDGSAGVPATELRLAERGWLQLY
jgi:hypothetical protein